MLPAAERGGGVRDDADVEAHHAGLELLDHALAAGEVLGEHVGDEAVLGVVREAHGLVLGRRTGRSRARAEDLLAQDVAARPARRSTHGRLVEGAGPSIAAPPVSSVAPRSTASPHERVGLRDRAVVDERADGDAVLGAAADLEAVHALGDAAGELVGDRPRAR